MTEKLSERVERLEGPDREIDRDIADAFGLGPSDDWLRKPQRGADGSWNMNSGDWISPCRTRLRKSLPYTASLDAAMSLVPEGWRISNFSQHDHTVLRERGEWMCSLYPDGRLDECNRDFDWPRCEHAATPAIALCAAALKARGL